MNHIKISVIVPVYQVEKYLEKCLNTLVRQSLREIEIIAVNDGSRDRSEEILARFQKDFPEKLLVFKKENGGLSDARNFGMDFARGDYITFLDSDDWVDLDLYERMWKKAEETGADAVACPIRYVWEDPNRSPKEISCGIPAYCEGEDCKAVFTRFYPAVWNKIYKRSVLLESGVRFKKGAFFEDVEFSHRLFPYLSSLASIEIASVNYLQREGSITSRPDKRLFDYLTNFESVLAWFREKNLFSPWEKELEYVTCRYLFATFLKRAGGLDPADFESAIEKSFSFVEENFPHRKKNPYYLKNGAKGLYLKFVTPGIARWMGKRGIQ